jgi:DNA-directed RNA polymerase specialized sigma24 family protein
VLGNMLDFSLDQHGSRFIQLKLDTLSPEDLAAAFRCGPGSARARARGARARHRRAIACAARTCPSRPRPGFNARTPV